MAHGGIAMFVPAGFQRWRRGAHGRSRRQRAVPHQTMQPWEPSSLSLSWPAAKPAIPMLTGLAGNTKRSNNCLGSGPCTTVPPSEIPESHPPMERGRGNRAAQEQVLAPWGLRY